MRPNYLLALLFMGISAIIQAQDDCGLIYVTPSGSGNTGTISNPTSLVEALQIHNNDPSRDRVLLQAGAYLVNQKLVVPSNISIDGGYVTSADGWIKNSSALTQVELNPPVEFDQGLAFHIGLQLLNVQNVLIQDLRITVLPSGTTAIAGNNGASIYGAYVSGSQNYTFRRCELFTGTAASGVNGDNGSNGANAVDGESGEGGCSGCSGFGSGGAGGFGANSGGNGGSGGYGDNNGAPGTNGQGLNPGFGGSGGGGDGSFCAFGCNSGGNGSGGTSGQPGTDGGDGVSAGTGSFFNGFYIPGSGTDGISGQPGSGGGGAGGGGGSDCCLDDRGGGGGGGGGGGFPGTAGLAGGGGGSSIALFLWNNGANAILEDIVLNPGGAGTGGTGGIGGNGGNGGAGGNAGPGADNGGPGGAGGPGGTGGDGGNGGNGANGQSIQLYENGVPVQNNETPWPYPTPVTASANQGCTQSEYILTKQNGTWNLGAMGAQLINDIGPGQTSYSTSDNTIAVYFENPGTVNLTTSNQELLDFLRIEEIRTPPTITGIPDTLCSGELIALSTPNSGVSYDWTVYDENLQQLQSYTTQNPPGFGANPNQWYYFQLRVKEECCGWSIPVYDSLFTSGPLESLNLVTLCEGDSLFLSGAWQTSSGIFEDSFQSTAGCDSLVTTALFFQACGLGGCTYPEASNYDPQASEDDGSCLFLTCEGACGPGTQWDELTEQCLPFCRADFNDDGFINTGDLLALLSVFGTPCQQ